MLNRRIKVICVIVGLCFSVIATSLLIHGKEQKLQRQVAKEVFRFHVIANSDSQEDQELKMQVKEAVLELMKRELPETKGLEETRIWVQRHLSELETEASSVIKEIGYAYPVNASMVSCHFPEKTYGDITFPEGTYEALRIEIGEAKGQNWWCALYPRLCFFDAVHAVVPEAGKEELKEVLDEEAYEMVTSKTIFRINWFFF